MNAMCHPVGWPIYHDLVFIRDLSFGLLWFGLFSKLQSLMGKGAKIAELLVGDASRC